MTVKLKPVVDKHENREGYSFFCPGCQWRHAIWITNPGGHSWTFDGNEEFPTFAPSLHIKTGHYCAGQPTAENCEWCKEDTADGIRSMCIVCHSFIRNGRIEFLSDCTHELAGQTVDLPDLDDRIVMRD